MWCGCVRFVKCFICACPEAPHYERLLVCFCRTVFTWLAEVIGSQNSSVMRLIFFFSFQSFLLCLPPNSFHTHPYTHVRTHSQGNFRLSFCPLHYQPPPIKHAHIFFPVFHKDSPAVEVEVFGHAAGLLSASNTYLCSPENWLIKVGLVFPVKLLRFGL